MVVDCKTVRTFAYSCTREQSKVWNEPENRERDRGERERRACEARATLTPRFSDFFTDFKKKKPTVLQYITLVPAFAIKLVSFLPDVAERERKAFSKMFRCSLHDMYCQSETKFAFSLHDTTIKFHTDLPNFIPIQNRNDLCGKGNVVSASSKP